MPYRVRIKETAEVASVYEVDPKIHGRLIGGSFSEEELESMPKLKNPKKKEEKKVEVVKEEKPKPKRKGRPPRKIN